jgi:multiple sugar transport system ATP-binding protein
VRQPEVFLFDEPLSNLDAALRVQMRAELAMLHRDLRTTMIYVTHDQVEAMTLGERIAVFNEGLIEQCGTPRELYERPANLFVASFIGSPSMNQLPVTWRMDDAGQTVLSLPGGAYWEIPQERLLEVLPDGKLTLGLRPEHLSLGDVGHGIPGTVDLVEYLGGEQMVFVTLAGSETRVTIKLSSVTDLRCGAVVGVQIDPQNFHLFGPAGRAINLL